MEVILLADHASLGKSGDTVRVKDGYAHNFLIPRKLATPVTEGAQKTVEARKRKEIKKRQNEKKAFEDIAAKIKGLSLTLPVESGVEDILFGSVTSEMVANVLRQEKIIVDKRTIEIEEPIKKLGIYNIDIKLHPEVKVKVKVWVVKK